MLPEQPRRTRFSFHALTAPGTLLGALLTLFLLGLLLLDALSYGLSQSRSSAPDVPFAGELVTVLLSVLATVLFGMGQKVDRLVPAVCFVVVGMLALWLGIYGTWRVPNLVVALCCFGLAVIAWRQSTEK